MGAPSTDGRIILVADDEPETLEMLRVILEQRGHEVITAADGREAIEQVVNYQPDLVLLDIMMPEVDGSAVCAHIKKSDLLKRIKVVLYTAKEKAQGRELAKKVGADGFLDKPFEPKRLWETLADLFAKQDKESPKLVPKPQK
jgi:CheY-like chemotaxis protein